MPSHNDQVHEDEVVIQCEAHRLKLFHDAYAFMLQEVLKPSGSIPARTSRYRRCPHPHAIMPAGSHNLSLEQRATCDPKHYNLGHLPLVALSKVKQSKKGPDGLYGLGARMEERYCVECYETMLEIYRRRQLRDNPSAVPLPGHPIFEIIYCIDCEERTIEGRPWLGPLQQSTHYGVERFKARWLWHRRQENPNYILAITPGRSEFVGFLPGRDPDSLYVNTDARDYEGKYEDGTSAEISGDEVDNCSLSKALERLFQRRVAHEEAKVERVRLANYSCYAYDDPLDDPSLLGPASSQRVNPQVPVLRISDPRDENPSDPDFRPPAARKTTLSTAPTPNLSSSKRRSLVLLIASKKVSSPDTVTKIDSGAPQTPREYFSAGLLMLRMPVEDPQTEHAGDDDAGHDEKASDSKSRIMAALLGNSASGMQEGGGVGVSVKRRSRSTSF